MRIILKKLDREIPLSNNEYHQLMDYIENLRWLSPESYQIFYDRYAAIMSQDYATELPRFALDLDDFINYLFFNPELIEQWDNAPALFPKALHPFLKHLESSSDLHFKKWLKELFAESDPLELPLARKKDIVIKYEEANPYKEKGIKSHFDRLSRYPFISRLQTYRYLSRAKAVQDRIEFLKPDQLGGIFTNKEKSIYYYIFLTEYDENKARYACSLLNKIFHDR